MHKVKVYVIHSPNVEVEVEKQVTCYAPPNSIYFLTQPNDLNHLKTLFSIEKEKNEWIRKYDNLLNGLRYWQARALSK